MLSGTTAASSVAMLSAALSGVVIDSPRLLFARFARAAADEFRVPLVAVTSLVRVAGVDGAPATAGAGKAGATYPAGCALEVRSSTSAGCVVGCTF